MGRVVKNARVAAQKYQVAIPAVELNGAAVEPDSVVPASTFYEPDEPVVASFAPAIAADEVAAHAGALIDDVESRAKAMLSDALDRARAMLSDAAQRADQVVEAARTQAQAEGYAAGTDHANLEMSDMMTTMRNLVDMARVERHKLIESAEPELVRLAMGIAERILHQQVALDRGVVVEMAKVAIARLVERESVTVRVNPADLERIRQHRDEFLNSSDVKHLRIIEDQRVDRGGVVVETDGGTIDARISTQLNEAKRLLHIEDEVIVPPADASESNLRAARAS